MNLLNMWLVNLVLCVVLELYNYKNKIIFSSVAISINSTLSLIKVIIIQVAILCTEKCKN